MTFDCSEGHSCNTSTIMFRLFFYFLVVYWTSEVCVNFWQNNVALYSDTSVSFLISLSLICRKLENILRKTVFIKYFLKIYNESFLLNARHFKKVRSLLFMNFLFSVEFFSSSKQKQQWFRRGLSHEKVVLI